MDIELACFIFSMVVGIAATWLLVSGIEKRRSRLFQSVADGVGFRYSPEFDRDALPYLHKTKLFKTGVDKKAYNFLVRLTDSANFYIFDYQYDDRLGTTRLTHKQTVVVIESPRLKLPQLTLAPESLTNTVASLFGYQDIHFAQHPKFSSAFLLRGPSESSIRSRLKNVNLEPIAALPRVQMEANRNFVMFWFGDRRTNPRHLRKLSDTAWEICELLCV